MGYFGIFVWAVSLLDADKPMSLKSKRSILSTVSNYQLIYITSVLSKELELLVLVRFGGFKEWSGVHRTTVFL